LLVLAVTIGGAHFLAIHLEGASAVWISNAAIAGPLAVPAQTVEPTPSRLTAKPGRPV
jgi:hypothetical protein